MRSYRVMLLLNAAVCRVRCRPVAPALQCASVLPCSSSPNTAFLLRSQLRGLVNCPTPLTPKADENKPDSLKELRRQLIAEYVVQDMQAVSVVESPSIRMLKNHTLTKFREVQSKNEEIKRLKDLEKEKDTLCCGLEILEKARIWYLQQLEENRAQQDNIKTKSGFVSCQEGAAETRSCLLRSRIQRVNGSLGSVMSETNVMSSSNPALSETMADCDLRWHNTVLTQEVSDKNRQISLLELENDILQEELNKVQTC